MGEFLKMTKTKQLIKELKEKIEKRKERCKIYSVNMHKDRELARLKANLQFAKKLIKAIKEDMDKKIIELIEEKRHKQKIIGVNTFLNEYSEELNKILDEVLK